MANSIIGNNQSPQISNNDMMSQFNKFCSIFQGDPQQTVMNMLRSGNISQSQLDSAIATAKRMQHMFR